jgi:hypothetical protein
MLRLKILVLQNKITQVDRLVGKLLKTVKKLRDLLLTPELSRVLMLKKQKELTVLKNKRST